jgi:hypothetical protein
VIDEASEGDAQLASRERLGQDHIDAKLDESSDEREALIEIVQHVDRERIGAQVSQRGRFTSLPGHFPLSP